MLILKGVMEINFMYDIYPYHDIVVLTKAVLFWIEQFNLKWN